MAQPKPPRDVPSIVTTHQQYLQDVDPKIRAGIQAMTELQSHNRVERSVLVSSLSVVPGKDKKDRDGNLVIENGQPAKWDDSFYVECQSMSGTVNIRVTEDIFKTLIVGNWYMAVGHIEVKSQFESSRMFETVKYTDFQPLFGVNEAS